MHGQRVQQFAHGRAKMPPRVIHERVVQVKTDVANDWVHNFIASDGCPVAIRYITQPVITEALQFSTVSVHSSVQKSRAAFVVIFTWHQIKACIPLDLNTLRILFTLEMKI